MEKAAIIGTGITPFKARYLDKSYFELAYDATKLALEDANENGVEITLTETFNPQFMGFIMNFLNGSLCQIY
ncbi:MAG: hypothetical protein ACFFAI_14940 [Promethearchaeota archaeon]